MKKTIVIFLAVCLCIGLCACGGNSEPTEPVKSTEAQKADELILAIGEVSLEKESAVLAAKVYYDTLTDEQRAQVENVALLEAAAAELDALKKEGEYADIYEKALDYETNLLVEEAYNEYAKLPLDYKDVKGHMQVLEGLRVIVGTWTCESNTAIASDGTEMGAPALTYDVRITELTYSDDGVRIGYDITANNNASTYTNSSIFKGHFDTWMMFKGDSSFAYVVKTEEGFFLPWYEDDGSMVFTGATIHSSRMGDMETTYTFTTDGKMNVQYSLEKNGTNTTVIHTYAK